jgi:hypothetical protein
MFWTDNKPQFSTRRLEDGDSKQEREAVIVWHEVRQPPCHIVNHPTLHLLMSEVIDFTLSHVAPVPRTTDDFLDAAIAWSVQHLRQQKQKRQNPSQYRYITFKGLFGSMHDFVCECMCVHA